ncbi:amino acid ABC transporter membrane protein (PAAT family) [Antricoccus suffuscus]|uniref:Amino acid ABC transporter membrane protein (PAAT family) n=1 Tax=Antricoccus suffuscus TaxID=1629062 RepID=A0A2T0YZ89_9ACTN|nr:amino acid ABC transporter permease [Antricoccus suffuscus]PRZ29218.1 amino acid ABC transporter membrane protein (PAAT family) [Antricoccus suffuscus]
MSSNVGATGHDGGEQAGYEHAEEIKAIPLRHPWRWVFVAVLAILAAMLINNVATNPNYRWSLVSTYLFNPQILRGVGYTLILTIGAMALALIVGVSVAVMRMSDNPVLSSVGWVYLWVFRGTPVYTQLVFWGFIGVLIPKFGLGIPFGPTFVEFDTNSVFTPFISALIGLALNEAAYMAEIVRGGLLAVDAGQGEASAALGMSTGKTMTRIVLPQAMRVIVPPTGNEFISMLKTTSLVLAVPFTLDLQFASNAIANRLYAPIPLLIVAAIWYLVVTSVLMVGQFYVERYYGRGSNRLQPPTPVQKLRGFLTRKGTASKTSEESTLGEGIDDQP